MKQYRIVFWIDDPETKEVYGEKKAVTVTGLSEKEVAELRRGSVEVAPNGSDQLFRLSVKSRHREIAKAAMHVAGTALAELMTEDVLPTPEVPLDVLKSA